MSSLMMVDLFFASCSNNIAEQHDLCSHHERGSLVVADIYHVYCCLSGMKVRIAALI